MLLDGETSQERLDLGTSQIIGVAFLVEEDKSTNPVDVSRFGAFGIMQRPAFMADLIEEPWLG